MNLKTKIDLISAEGLCVELHCEASDPYDTSAAARQTDGQ